MNNLNWEIIEVLDYYDGPLIFSFKEKNDFKLAYFGNEIYKAGVFSAKLYMVFSTSESLVGELTQNKISIQEFMYSHENVELVQLGEKAIIVDRKLVKVNEAQEFIPEANVFLR